jgi:hypothetical protein
MIASRITKAFQFTALVLAFSVLNVYVMAGPVRTPTDPRTTDASANQPKSEKVVVETSADKTSATDNQQLTTQAAAEKMTLTAGTKSVLTRIFSKRDLEARAATSNSFLNTKTNFADTFKTPAKNNATPQSSGQTSSDDSDHTGRRSMWIAVGIIAAVLTVAVIGLRHDRSHPNAANGL